MKFTVFTPKATNILHHHTHRDFTCRVTLNFPSPNFTHHIYKKILRGVKWSIRTWVFSIIITKILHIVSLQEMKTKKYAIIFTKRFVWNTHILPPIWEFLSSDCHIFINILIIKIIGSLNCNCHKKLTICYTKKKWLQSVAKRYMTTCYFDKNVSGYCSKLTRWFFFGTWKIFFWFSLIN